MSEELKITMKATFEKGDVLEKILPGQISIDVSGSRMIHNIQSVGTNAEALLLGDVVPGFIMGINLDTSNYVELSPDGTNQLIKVKAGDPFLFRLTSAACYAKANTSACNVEYWAVDA